MSDEFTYDIVEDADRSLAKYIGSYENINPDLYSKYGEDAYALIDSIAGKLPVIIQANDENERAHLIDCASKDLSQMFNVFSESQVKELVVHFVEYYFSCMQ